LFSHVLFDRATLLSYHGGMFASPQKYSAILFDLDGTLLDVDMRRYIPAYVQGLADCVADIVPHETASRTLLELVHQLIRRDDGDESNNRWYLVHAAASFGIDPDELQRRFSPWFAEGLTGLDPLMAPAPLARSIVEGCLRRGQKVAVATNPVFPQTVIASRLRCAGLADLELSLVTNSDNSRRCKPNPQYFHDVLDTLGVQAADCLMVGNDTGHDLAARYAGIATFLVDTWLIDRARGGYVSDFCGDHAMLRDFLAGDDPAADD